MARRMERRQYAQLYGPTTGDRVRLGDTALVAEVERDLTSYGDECVFGGGKVIRDGMGQAAGVTDERRARPGRSPTRWSSTTPASSRPTSASRHGRIAGIGKAGNPDVMAGVTRRDGRRRLAPRCIAGEGLILTAGGIDSHIHFICPQQAYEAIGQRHHHDDRRRHRAGHRHQRDHLHARRWNIAAHAAGARRAAR